MAGTALGIDFGTSNSAVGIATPDGSIKVAEWAVPEALAGTSATTSTMPSVIFAPNYDREFHVGYDAVEKYMFAGLDGRFMQSIKGFLPSKSFTGTSIRARHYSVESLVARIIKRLVQAAQTQLGCKDYERVVLGRPARFSLDDEEDQLAEGRLLEAAQLAGLPEVTLVIEPLAAALAYEARLDQEEIVLVADLGGGTSDFTVINVGPRLRGQSDRTGSILASAGLPQAGDAIDGEVVRARLFDQFGYGSTYDVWGETTRVPSWIFKKLMRWNHVSFLKSKKNLDFLRTVSKSSSHKEDIDRMIEVIDFDLSYILFRAVERAKRGLSESEVTHIVDEEHALPLDVSMSRPQFTEAVSDLVDRISGTAEKVLKDAGVQASKVDAVFLTGGTSLVGDVRTAFENMFGRDKLRGRGTFTSVVDGLARAAAS